MKKCTPWILLKIVAVIILLSILPTIIALYITSTAIEWQGPDSGLWYCDDIQTQLCFEIDDRHMNREIGWVDTRSYMLIGNTPIMCSVDLHSGTYVLCISHQDDSQISQLGKKLFEGEFVSLDEQNYVVSKQDGSIYTFRRIGEFSLDETLKNYQDQIASYAGVKTVDEARHVAFVVQHAKALWETELGLDVTGITPVVEFDLDTDCWLVTANAPNSPVVLIKTHGDVIGVFRTGDGSLS